MTPSVSRLLRAVTGLVAVTLVFPALADIRITLDRQGAGELPVQYRDADHLRIGDDRMSSHYLTSGGRDFVLMTSPDGDKRFAMDMDQFLAREDAPASVEPDTDRLTATKADREETINGVTGQVYRVEGADRSWELVLTEDDTVSTITEAVYSAEIRMARMSGQAMAVEPLAAELALARALGAPGILRGQLYTFSGMEKSDNLPEDHFTLADDTLVIEDWKQMQDAYH